MQPRTLEVFDDLGPAGAALAAGRSDHHLRLYAGGTLAADLAAPARPPRPGVPYPNLLVLPQWRTEELLRDRLAELGGAVEAGRSCGAATSATAARLRPRSRCGPTCASCTRPRSSPRCDRRQVSPARWGPP
ncbi:hypothetical protein [Pseudonocardia humida]|uniref:Uncharacterized protein n=1 Tax=Pseudonocardia humida TaxID=2800819 RepID=A0ABT1A7W5_9PSEU|nr:hypothetical protein [Pseudonocardia humida]MCO1659016.1 hypothetical protein [Pseudonocardia humida]